MWLVRGSCSCSCSALSPLPSPLPASQPLPSTSPSLSGPSRSSCWPPSAASEPRRQTTRGADERTIRVRQQRSGWVGGARTFETDFRESLRAGARSSCATSGRRPAPAHWLAAGRLARAQQVPPSQRLARPVPGCAPPAMSQPPLGGRPTSHRPLVAGRACPASQPASRLVARRPGRSSPGGPNQMPPVGPLEAPRSGPGPPRRFGHATRPEGGSARRGP